MHNKTFKREQVVEILGSVLNRVSDKHPMDSHLLSELQQLKNTIDRLREELSSTHPGQIQNHIPSATDELDAIVSTTENATHTIMEACEAIQHVLENKPTEASADIENEVIRIIEACTFQDLTGQRISKIIRSLGEIDKHASALSKLLSDRFANMENTKAAEPAEAKDSLLNGPALPSQGISQEEIDKLLNDFG